MGDLDRRDADRFLYIVDRKTDMFVSGGVTIYSREIQEVLMHQPAVSKVAAIGMPDARWGETLHAVVALRERHDLNLDDVTVFCANRLAPYKTPRTLGLVPSLPRNASGKVLKTVLRSAA